MSIISDASSCPILPESFSKYSYPYPAEPVKFGANIQQPSIIISEYKIKKN